MHRDDNGFRDGFALRAAAIAAALLLASCGVAEEAGAGANEAAGTPAAATGDKPSGWAQCAVCHSTEPGRHGLGPSLAGVSGRAAASLPDFDYSPAMKASGLTWDRATLDEYLKAPMTKVPGTRMAFAGIRDDAERAEVVEYVLSLK
jgi:cytochrome c2